VLEQIGLAGTAAFRVSLGPTSTEADVEAFLSVVPEVVGDLRRVERSAAEAMARFRPPVAD
jgi:cysteine sulfinate desulfinase/cysteine desulfurase-like protein